MNFLRSNDAYEGPIAVPANGFPYLGNRAATQIYVSVMMLAFVDSFQITRG